MDSIAVTQIKRNEKIQQKYIETYPDENRKIGITSLRIVIFKDSDHGRLINFKLTGEFTGKLKESISFFIMVYNADNELIEANFHQGKDSHLSTDQTFEAYFEIPWDELISKFVIKIIPDRI